VNTGPLGAVKSQQEIPRIKTWICATLDALGRHLPVLKDANRRYNGIFGFISHGQNGEIQYNVVCEPDEVLLTLEVDREVLQRLARTSEDGDDELALALISALLHMLGIVTWEDEDEWRDQIFDS
jgi:hypothetical protein